MALASWWQRRKARFRLRSTVGLWYHPGYQTESLRRTAHLLELESGRAERVLDFLAEERLVRQRDIRQPSLVDIELLSRVHPYSYLEEVTHSERLGRIFGLEPHDVDVDAILESQRRAVGGTVAAARWVAVRPSRIGFNLGGGFHHAEPEMGGGFCVYNDVAVAISDLRNDGYSNPIAIVDLDFHQGNGSLATFSNDPTVLTYSLHGSVWSHTTDTVSDIEISLPENTGDASYMSTLRESLPDALMKHGTRMIFYVAGTDVLEGDDLGAFALTLAGVFDRDRLVIDLARELDCPAVVTLAGGYGSKSWQASAAFLRWLLTDEEQLVEMTRQDEIRLGFRRIAWNLDPLTLQRESDDVGLSLDDLMGDLDDAWGRGKRFLGYYSVQGVELALEQFGLLAQLRRKGFSDLNVKVDPSNRNRQRVTIHGRRDGGPLHLLVDIILRRTALPAPEGMDRRDELKMLSIEWLLLQDPAESFSFRRQKLPGQDYPGLGLVREVMELLYQASRVLGLDGIVAHPSRFHVAKVGAAHLFFLDPGIQGEFDALRETFEGFDLAEASQLIEDGLVRNDEGVVIEWNPTDIVGPVSERMRSWFESEHYRSERRAARNAMRARGIVVAGRSIGAPDRG